MKSRPMLFSAPMVRALLAGSKTQTRRAYKTRNGGVWPNPNDTPGMRQIMRNCPYGQPGDQIWVRETWAHSVHALAAASDEEGPFVYAATEPWANRIDDRWHPSIHMPRAASRITLEITGMRMELLQDISQADAIAEGIESVGRGWRHYGSANAGELMRFPKNSYISLWESINGTGSWAANPWVWVIEFKVVKP